ncbi:hypothetical protein [Bacillus sp. ISL-4]|uniref:hypothetical protein n=1 Tax=Bacillus sp. ISL-4 TaxID=2819125 RepID=UPI001BE4EE62|nr:hypothetical protein [Bacillus sp. ISL-4]
MFIKDFDLINYKIFIELVIESIEAWRKERNYDSFPTPPTPFLTFIRSDVQDILSDHQQKIRFF